MPLRKEELNSIYCYVVHHLTVDERKKVEKHSPEALNLNLTNNSDVISSALVDIVKNSSRT